MFKRILVAVDGSDTANRALLVALRLAGASGGQVRLVHVLEHDAEVDKDILQRALAIADDGEVPADSRLLGPGSGLGECVAQAAAEWNADLVVAGTHGRRGVQRALLGSGAEAIARLACVPVLLVPGHAAT